MTSKRITSRGILVCECLPVFTQSNIGASTVDMMLTHHPNYNIHKLRFNRKEPFFMTGFTISSDEDSVSNPAILIYKNDEIIVNTGYMGSGFLTSLEQYIWKFHQQHLFSDGDVLKIQIDDFNGTNNEWEVKPIGYRFIGGGLITKVPKAITYNSVLLKKNNISNSYQYMEMRADAATTPKNYLYEDSHPAHIDGISVASDTIGLDIYVILRRNGVSVTTVHVGAMPAGKEKYVALEEPFTLKNGDTYAISIADNLNTLGCCVARIVGHRKELQGSLVKDWQSYHLNSIKTFVQEMYTNTHGPLYPCTKTRCYTPYMKITKLAFAASVSAPLGDVRIYILVNNVTKDSITISQGSAGISHATESEIMVDTNVPIVCKYDDLIRVRADVTSSSPTCDIMVRLMWVDGN